MSAASASGSSVCHPEVGLIPAPAPRPGRPQRAQDRHDLLGGPVVGGPIRRQEHRVGTASVRLGKRHARVHAERPGLVRGGGDDLAGPTGIAVAADDHRPTSQLRASPHLDRRRGSGRGRRGAPTRRDGPRPRARSEPWPRRSEHDRSADPAASGVDRRRSRRASVLPRDRPAAADPNRRWPAGDTGHRADGGKLRCSLAPSGRSRALQRLAQARLGPFALSGEPAPGRAWRSVHVGQGVRRSSP